MAEGIPFHLPLACQHHYCPTSEGWCFRHYDGPWRKGGHLEPVSQNRELILLYHSEVNWEEWFGDLSSAYSWKGKASCQLCFTSAEGQRNTYFIQTLSTENILRSR